MAPGARKNLQHAVEAGIAAGTAGSQGGGVARGKRVPRGGRRRPGEARSRGGGGGAATANMEGKR